MFSCLQAGCIQSLAVRSQSLGVSAKCTCYVYIWDLLTFSLTMEVLYLVCYGWFIRNRA